MHRGCAIEMRCSGAPRFDGARQLQAVPDRRHYLLLLLSDSAAVAKKGGRGLPQITQGWPALRHSRSKTN